MGAIERSAATLRFFGDDLDPNEISRALGAISTVGVKRGEVWRNSGGREIVASRGSWRLEVADRRPADLDGQIHELFDQLTTDLEVWTTLSSRFKADIFCGLFLGCANEGEGLKPETLAALSSRGLMLGLDIYGPAPDNQSSE